MGVSFELSWRGGVMLTIATGTVIDRYVIRGEIGSGSMGDVLEGEDEDLKRPVAIKILSERHRENKELRARFVREARAVAAISHPNVVQVFTTGTFDDRPYIAMELLKGVDLGSVIKDRGVMSSIQAAKATLDSALGLDAAAKAGLIHRDVKPSNLVLIDTGAVKVTDFGLAKPLNPSSEPALTAMGVVVGTPDYIAPEQARGDPIDERVDIYALGGTLFFLLTGTPPYRKGNPVDDKYLKVVARHLKDPVPNPRTKNKTADRELCRLGRQMMAKKPVERPGYPELLEQLGQIIARLEQGGESSSLPAVSTDSVRTSPAPTPFVGTGASLRAPTNPPGQARSSAQQPRASSGSPIQLDDSAATMVRPSGSHSAPGSTHGSYDSGSAGFSDFGAPRRSRALVGLTIAASLVFLIGLILILFGPIPRAKTAVVPAVIDAGIALRVDAAAAADPIPPKDMLLIRKPGGKPWFFVAKQAVLHGDFAKILPRVKKPIRNSTKNNKPVTGVRYSYAQDYANAFSQGGRRLLTPEEWLAASQVDGFDSSETLWEWVDDGTTDGNKSLRRKPDKLIRRKPTEHKDVTFRLAADLPE